MATKVAVGTYDRIAWHVKALFPVLREVLRRFIIPAGLKSLRVLLSEGISITVFSSSSQGLLYSKAHLSTNGDE